MFHQILTLAVIEAPAGSYTRLWSAVITLWYFIWQWLQPRHTLEAVVTDARRGGADRLCPKAKPLSKGIKSRATTAFCDARQRLPLEWVRGCFLKLAAALTPLGGWLKQPLPIERGAEPHPVHGARCSANVSAIGSRSP